MQTARWETITGNENLLILAPRPGDESLLCGGLIAESCRRGRPPYVVVLTDGFDCSQEAAIRTAVRLLGLPANRLLLAGLRYDSIPVDGAAFDAIVHGITMGMWARDCNVICAPGPDGEGGDRTAAHRIAAAVAERSGVGRLSAVSSGGLALDVRGCLETKRSAISAYGRADTVTGFESFAVSLA